MTTTASANLQHDYALIIGALKNTNTWLFDKQPTLPFKSESLKRGFEAQRVLYGSDEDYSVYLEYVLSALGTLAKKSPELVSDGAYEVLLKHYEESTKAEDSFVANNALHSLGNVMAAAPGSAHYDTAMGIVTKHIEDHVKSDPQVQDPLSGAVGFYALSCIPSDQLTPEMVQQASARLEFICDDEDYYTQQDRVRYTEEKPHSISYVVDFLAHVARTRPDLTGREVGNALALVKENFKDKETIGKALRSAQTAYTKATRPGVVATEECNA